MKKDEKMPEHNPEMVCPQCKIKLPTWTLRRPVDGNNLKVFHNFCPHIVDGQIVNLCMDCKMRQSAGRTQGW